LTEFHVDEAAADEAVVPEHRRSIDSNGSSKPPKAQIAASACEWVNIEKGKEEID